MHTSTNVPDRADNARFRDARVGHPLIERLRVTSASRGRIEQQLTDTRGEGSTSNIDLIPMGSAALINVNTLS
jgi:hypothetical protein